MSKSYNQLLQDHIDDPRQEITKFRRWKIKNPYNLSREFIYKTGTADAIDISGTVEKPEIRNERLPVSLLIHEPSQTRVLWQRTNTDQATILVVDRPKFLQGNPYKLLPCLNKACDIIFNHQKYKSIYGRAGQPLKDVGVRNKEWRSDLVKWKTRSNSVRPVLLPRLQCLWLRIAHFCVPAKCFSDSYPDTGIIMMSPKELKKLDKDTLQDLDNVHGDAKRKWSFIDLIK